jgi:outer membrane biosynthesis protein TonB
MNKFKHLQIIGTITLFLPVILVIGAIVIYTLSTSEVVKEPTEETTQKPDTAKPVQPLILALPAPVPAPVVKEPTPPPAPVPVPLKVVKDTVIEKVAAELDTTK